MVSLMTSGGPSSPVNDTTRRTHLQRPVGPLAQARHRKAWSQQIAAESCGVSRQTWAAWEARTRPITLQHIDAIVTHLDLSPENVEEIIAWGRLPLQRAATSPRPL